MNPITYGTISGCSNRSAAKTRSFGVNALSYGFASLVSEQWTHPLALSSYPRVAGTGMHPTLSSQTHSREPSKPQQQIALPQDVMLKSANAMPNLFQHLLQTLKQVRGNVVLGR